MVILENHMCCFKAWAYANFPTRWNFSSKWQLSLFSHDLTSPHENGFKLQHTRITCEKEVSWITAILSAWFLLCGSSQRPYCCEEHVAERVDSAGGPIWEEDGWHGCPSTEMKATALVIKLCRFQFGLSDATSITHSSSHHLPSSIHKLLVINAIFFVGYNKGWAEEASHH